MKKGTTIVWVLLILLTSGSFLLGENGASGLFILMVAGCKLFLVAWFYMDLRKAAFVWMGALMVVSVTILSMGVWLG